MRTALVPCVLANALSPEAIVDGHSNERVAEWALYHRDGSPLGLAQSQLLSERATASALFGFFDKAQARTVCRRLPARVW